MLKRGETVHSVVYSGDGSQAEEPEGAARPSRPAPDAIAHLFGCRYCYPANSRHPRICPVCGNEVSADGYVVARMFERRDRKHIHVLGCTECRGAAFKRAASVRAHE